jgi:curli biogenesis system outer membrane secretion channel CsgG
LVSALALAAAAPAVAQSQRPTVAVLSFEYGTLQHWWSGNQDIGEGISDLIVDELVNDGSYRVIERKRLDAILAEQNFSNSERADPSAKTLVQIGKALGVKYLIVGSVTKFGTEQSSKSFGGGGFGSAYGLGNVGTSKGKANVAITARIIDTTTGEIMASAKGEGTSKRSGFLLGGAGGGGGGGGGGHIAFGASEFRDTILGEATEAAVKMTTDKLVAAKNRLQ